MNSNSTGRPSSLIIESDTEGVLGQPPVTASVLEKIGNCDIFIPDLTFVARTEGGKLVPNPNVMTEYGYALKATGYAAMMPVMNTSFAPTGLYVPRIAGGALQSSRIIRCGSFCHARQHFLLALGKPSFPKSLTKEFLLVDLVNNVDQLVFQIIKSIASIPANARAPSLLS